MNIRSARVETDLQAIAAICTTCEPQSPVTEERARSWFTPGPAGRIDLRLVSVDDDCSVTGYACAIHEPSMPDRHFYVWAGVDPTSRCRGAGSALWNACLEFLQAHDANRLMSEVLDNDPVGLAFANKRGFSIDRHTFHSILDLQTFDETPYLPIIAGLEAEGIRFCTLADLPDTPDTQERYYQLNLATVRDIPGEVWNFDAYPIFFQQHIINAPWFRKDCQVLALDDDTFTGFASISLKPEQDGAYNATTGVIRPYRGRRIALALKVLAAQLARERGARWIATDNDSINAPMLAVNRRMGYRAGDGKYYLVRWLSSD